MSISSIGGNISPLSSLQSSSISAINSATPRVDRDGDGGRVNSGGKFTSALTQALAQLGVNTTSTTSDSSGTTSTSATTSTTATASISDSSSAQDPQQALAAFAQSLFAALQSQNGSQTNSSTSSSTSTGTDPTAAVSGGGGHHHHGGGGGGISKLEGGLQNLIQQLSSSSTDTTGSGNNSTSTSTSGTSNSAIDALQQSFSNLLAADGQSGNGATLSSFLSNIEKNLQGATPTGNVVSTKV